MRAATLTVAMACAAVLGCRSGGMPGSGSRQSDPPAPAAESTAAAEAAAPAEATVASSAYDLYSWLDHGEWHFSLLPGKRQLRSFGEVSAEATSIEGLGSLRARLRKLPRDAEVYWAGHQVVNTAMPSDEIVGQISSYCAQYGLKLAIQE